VVRLERGKFHFEEGQDRAGLPLFQGSPLNILYLKVEFLQAKKGEKCQWRDCSRKVFSLFPNWLHLLPQYALGEAKVDVVSLVIG